MTTPPSPANSRSAKIWIAGIVVIFLGAGLLGYAVARRDATPEPVGVAGYPTAGGVASPTQRPATQRPAAPARPTPDLAAAPPAFDGEPATERIEFQPAMPGGEPRLGGICEREALIAPRVDAFHCLVDGQPYDPCYRVTGDDELVICNARPTVETGAFLLRLVEPPPPNRVTELPEEPWMLDLGETVCERRLGLQLVTFGGKPIRYDCRDGSLVIDLAQGGPVWAAQRVVIRIEEAPVADSAAWAPVRRAWW